MYRLSKVRIRRSALTCPARSITACPTRVVTKVGFGNLGLVTSGLPNQRFCRIQSVDIDGSTRNGSFFFPLFRVSARPAHNYYRFPDYTRITRFAVVFVSIKPGYRLSSTDLSRRGFNVTYTRSRTPECARHGTR